MENKYPCVLKIDCSLCDASACWNRRTPYNAESPATIHQHSNGASPEGEICLCDDCIVESCDMRGQAVECSGRVTESGKLRHC